MAFVHRRSKSENDKSVVIKAEPLPVSDRDCGFEESSDEEDVGCDGQAAETFWSSKAALAPEDYRRSGLPLCQSMRGNCGPDREHDSKTHGPQLSSRGSQAALSTTGGSRLSRPCHIAAPVTVSDQFTYGNYDLGYGPNSSLDHVNYQASNYGQCYYHPHISAAFPQPQYTQLTPVPFPAFGYYPQTFYPIPEEAAGLHWQQHGSEERDPVASSDHWEKLEEKHDIRERRIYLGNLRYTATAEDIRKHLDHHGLGQGAEAIFMTRAAAGRNRGFCFVTFDSTDRAQEAMEQLGGSEHLGRKLICRHSLPRGMHYEPNPGTGPESQTVSQARKHGSTGPHRIPFEDVGADDYVVPPYGESKVFSPKRDWISAGGCVVEVANLPPMPGEGACLREMELLFKGFDV